ncbi:MAG: hypothetical protein Q7T80_03325 [Methanoregula sp.]|nr:hypothetical protein [Methanoregula sp.]
MPNEEILTINNLVKKKRPDVIKKVMMIEEKAAKLCSTGVVFKLICDKPAILKSYKLLRVTAVLGANDDGSHALGKIENGKVIPAEPFLRNPLKHSSINDNYVKDWISLANLQLIRSGASFGLDLENITYVLEKNTLMNTLECGSSEEQGKAVKDLIEQKANDSPENNPYHNSVILLFRWGADPNSPALQACCSGVKSQFILLNRYDENPIMIDGELVWPANNQLTHEFGHFMGLVHPFINISNDMAGISDLAGRNPDALPLLEENLPHMPGVTTQDLAKAKKDAKKLIKDWVWSFDQDNFCDPPLIPDGYEVTDTPIDLGGGFPLIFGHKACSGSFIQSVELHDGTTTNMETNDTVRKNVMSYWRCNPAEQIFSADQVKRMEWVLENLRSNLINRVIFIIHMPKLCKKMIKKGSYKELYEDLQKYVHIPITGPEPWPDWKRVINILKLDEIKDKKLIDEIKIITHTIPPYIPWSQPQFEIHLNNLEKSGMIETIQPATMAGICKCGVERKSTQRILKNP